MAAQDLAPEARVFYAMDPGAMLNGFAPNESVVQGMVDALVAGATGKRTAREGWASLVKPTDVVGIKVAAAPGAITGTHPAVVRAIARGLAEAGVPPERILVWDRNREDLAAAGYTTGADLYQVRWIDPAKGYDRDAMLTAPVLGRLIWGDSKFGERSGTRLVDLLSTGEQLSSTSYYAAILTKEVTKIINVPALTDSFMCGINGAIANMTLWNVDNWRRFIRAPDFGDPYLAEIYADPIVNGKVVLHILDALTLQFAGGPFPNPNFARSYASIFASTDPVALDATAIVLLEEYRAANKLPPLAPMAGHVQSAADYGLGTADPRRIETVRVGIEQFR